MKHEEPDLTALAKELRRNATPAEKIMWQRLRNRKLGGFKTSSSTSSAKTPCWLLKSMASIIKMTFNRLVINTAMSALE